MLRLSALRRVLRMREALANHVPQGPLAHRCPFCGAKPGKRCQTLGGKRVGSKTRPGYHKQRTA